MAKKPKKPKKPGGRWKMKTDFTSGGLASLASLASYTLEKAKKKQTESIVSVNTEQNQIIAIEILETKKTTNVPTHLQLRNDKEIFFAGYKWINQHMEQLLKNGWTKPELFRRNKARGIAWLKLWGDPEVKPTIGDNGQILFLIQRLGKIICQTAWPEIKNPSRLKK